MALPAGFVPDREDSGVKPGLPAGFVPDGNIPAPAPIPSKTAETNSAIYHGIANGGTFGAGAAVSAAIDTTLNKLLPQFVLDKLQSFNEVGGSAGLPLNKDATYDERRAAYNRDMSQSQQAHPIAFAGGETFGGMGTGGSGVAAGEAVAGKLGGGAAARLAGAATSGAVTGAEFGAGSAASQGLDPVQGLKQAGKGALVGAASGTAMHGITELTGAAVNRASQALEDKYVKTFGNEVAGGATKKGTFKGWSTAINRTEEEGVPANAAKNYVKSPEMAPVESAARHGKYQQAIEAVDKNLSKYGPGRQANYAAVEEAKPFQAGEGLASLDRELFLAKNKHKDHQAVTALEKTRTEWVNDYSSADARAVQNVLLRPANTISTETATELEGIVNSLPQSGQITRTDLAKAADKASPEALQYINDHILDPKQGLLHWDPKATVPVLELRAEASRRQQSAMQAFDALNPQFSEHTKSAIKKAINGALEKHLDSVAAQSPALADTVRRIRQDDVKFNVLLAARKGLQEQLEKQTRKESQLKALIRHAATFGTIPSAAYAAGEAQDAAKDLEEGKLLQAGKHGAEALFFGGLAGAGAYRTGSIVHNRLSNTQGPSSPGAAAFTNMLRQRLPNAVTGTVTDTTLGQVGQQ